MLQHRFYILLFFYHLLFIVFSYFFVLKNGGDAHLYWGITFDLTHRSWLDFADYGAKFIVFLNYPLIKAGVPFWGGFLLYGLFGFIGILKWMQWAQYVVRDKLTYKGFDFLYLLFLLPNLHFWTSGIGKEPIVFWGIAAVLYGITTQKLGTFSFILGSVTVLIIRPHVALMLLAAIMAVIVFQKGVSFKKRMLTAFIAGSGLLLLLYAVFQTTGINYWNWQRIQYFNEYSVLSFRHSGSYVPMLDYPYVYKWFSFLFRPLFFDAHTVLALLASLENAFLLLVFFTALYLLIRFYRKMDVTRDMKIVFLFSFIAGLLYVERYANLGIFMRTKIMFEPFLLVSLQTVIVQGAGWLKNKRNG